MKKRTSCIMRFCDSFVGKLEKPVLLISILFCFQFSYGLNDIAKSTFDYAVKLNDNYLLYRNSPNQENKMAILKVILEFKNISNYRDINEQLFKQLEANPFLGEYIKNIKISQNDIDELCETFKSMFALSLVGEKASFASALSPQILIESLARVIAERFKQELINTFLDVLQKKWLDIQFIQDLLPKTTDYLKYYRYLSANIYLFTSNLRQVFYEDLKYLDCNAIRGIRKWLEEDSARLDKLDDGKLLFLACADFITSFRLENKRLLSAINTFYDDYAGWLSFVDNKDIVSMMHLVSIISRNISKYDSVTRQDKLNSINELNNMLMPANSYLPNIFIGLIYEKENTVFSDLKIGGKRLIDILEAEDNKLNQFIKYIHRFAQSLQQTQDEFIKLVDNNQLKYDKFYDFSILLLSLLEMGQADDIHFLYRIPTEMLKRAKDVFEISKNIIDKNYVLAISKSLSVICDVLPAEKIPKEIFTYTSFMASLLEAKTPQEMKSVLESVVLPAGSIRWKRESSFSLTLNSYAGLSYFRESRNGNQNINSPQDKTNNISFLAPVGISLNYRLLSLFASFLDLGAIVYYQLSDENGNSNNGLSEITWNDVISPGIFGVIGLGNKNPVSIGAGIQFSPKLEKISEAGLLSTRASRLRWTLFLAIDIPLLFFYGHPY